MSSRRSRSGSSSELAADALDHTPGVQRRAVPRPSGSGRAPSTFPASDEAQTPRPKVARGTRHAGVKPKTDGLSCVRPTTHPPLSKCAADLGGSGSWQGVPALGCVAPSMNVDPLATPVPQAPGAGLHTFLPGQSNDVRGTLTHHLGDVHRAIDPACDGDGPEHGLGLQLGTWQIHGSHEGAVGEGSHRPPPVPRTLPESRPFDFPQG